jgi:drug/metabolite transporter (DMT)-like permease
MNQRWFYLLVLIAMGLGWGSTQTLGKIAVSTGHRHFGLIFWQLVIAVLILGALLLIRRKSVPINPASLRFATIIAVIGTIIPNSTFYIAVGHLPAGIMSILISTVPLLAFPIALALGTDQFGAARLIGLLCGLLGVILIAVPEGALPGAGMALWLPVAIIGPLFYAMESNYVARFGTAGMDAMQAMFLASLVGMVLVFPLVLTSGQWITPLRPFGPPEWALIASSSLHAFAYTAYVWLAARAGAVFASQTSYIVTGSGVIWAMLLLGEGFSAWVWAALAVMLAGLTLVQPRKPAASVV